MKDTASNERRKRKVPIHIAVWEKYLSLSIWNKLALWVLILAAPMAFASYKLLKPVYKNWVAQNSLKQAEESIAKDDMNAASLAFRKAIQSAPKNPAVWEKVADFLEEGGSIEVIGVLDQLTKLRPGDSESRYRLAEAALKYRRPFVAQRAVATIPESERGTARFLRISAELSAMRGEFALARETLTRLVELDPDDGKATFDLMLVNLKVGDAAEQQEAVAALADIADTDGEYSTSALRELAAYAATKNDAHSANVFSERLVARDDSTIQDRLFHLNTEIITKSFTLPASLQNVTEYAEANPEHVPVVANFLVSRGRLSQVRNWVEELPEEIRNQPGIQSLQIELALQDRDIESAFAVLRETPGGLEANPEVIDLAQQATESYAKGSGGSEQTWKKALLLADGQPQTLQLLAIVARNSGWTSALADALWALSSAMPGRTEVWSDLTRLELSRKNSTGALRSLSGALQADPYDPQLRNDWAFLALLLNTVSSEDVLETTKQNIEADPVNPFFLTTHALALFQSGNQEEAIETIDRVPAEQRVAPERSLVVALILADSARKAEAAEALERVRAISANLLPEQEKLYLQAEAVLSGDVSRAQVLQQVTTRTTVSEEDRAAFNETLRAQRDAVSTDEARAELKRKLAENVQQREEAGTPGRTLTDQLRAESESRQRTPEELRELMRSIRGEEADGTPAAAEPAGN